MKFLENLKTSQIAKLAGLALVAILVLSFVGQMFGITVGPLLQKGSYELDELASDSYMKAYPESAPSYGGMGAPGLSSRNVETSLPMPPEDQVIPGDDAEEFEVTEYSASFETRDREGMCATLAGLKGKEYVIFESATEYDTGCNYTFKVRHDHVEEILTAIKEMDPKDLSENTYTIKRLVTDYTSEIEILEKKLATIEETLETATRSYDDVTRLATQTKDVESLAKIIDSKLNIIEKLTQKRIETSAALERLERSKAEQLDRLEYTYFHASVTENTFIDGEGLKDSWKYAVKEFVRNVNETIQNITIGLLSFLFIALQYAIYAFILLIIAKYGWKAVRYIWEK